MKIVILCISLVVLALAACSGGPLREDVIAQARPNGQIAFDVVKIDDAVLTTLLAQPPPAFHERFKTHLPPPELKIAVGDTVSVVIWESAADGLFGNSLTELLFPAGAAARVLTRQLPASLGAPRQAQGQTASPDTLSRLFGGAAAPGGTAAPDGTTALGGTAALGGTGALGGAAGLGLTGLADQPLGVSGSLSTSSSEALAAATGTGRGTATGFTAGATPGFAAGTTPGATAETLSRRQLAGAGAENLSAQRIEELLKVAAQSGRPGTLIPDQEVGADGAITIPYAGRIAVADRSPSEVQHRIEQLLGPKALDPQALVIVKRSAANSVSVAGEVIGGKRVPLSPGGDRLLQVIAAAGGAKAPVHDTFVQLSRGGVTASVPLATLVADPGQDIFAEPGDVLTLTRRPQTFSAFGASAKNAAITFTSDRLSLTEALAKAGGLLDNRADPRAVFLFRYEPVGIVQALGQPIATGARGGLSPIVYRLDLKEAESYLLARRFPVHDKDIIFVADAEIQPIYHFIQALAQLSGPIQTGFLPCYVTKC